MIYKFNSGDNVKKRSGLKSRIRRKLYDNVNPYTYDNFQKRLVLALKGDDKDVMSSSYAGYSPDRDDIFATYLQIPVEERHNIEGVKKVEKSQYHPTIGGDPKKQYSKISLSEAEKDALVLDAMGENLMAGWSLQNYFGPHATGHGFDEKGEYVSYYDKWDVNPAFGESSDRAKSIAPLEAFFRHKKGDDVSLGIGKPIDFYDRLYLNDYAGISGPELGPDEYYGGYIRPAYIAESPKISSKDYHITGNDLDDMGFYPTNRFVLGGILKAQDGTSEVPKREPPKPAIPVKGSKPQRGVPQSLQPYVPPLERLKKKLAEMRRVTQRPKVIGPWEMANGKPARVVENGGNIA